MTLRNANASASPDDRHEPCRVLVLNQIGPEIRRIVQTGLTMPTVHTTTGESDHFIELAQITARIQDLGHVINELSATRTRIVIDLAQRGYSHAQIAAAAGLSRGRIFQILR